MNKILITIIFIGLVGFIVFAAQTSNQKTATSFTTPSPDISQLPIQLSPMQSNNQSSQNQQQTQQQPRQMAEQQALDQIKQASISATIKTAKGDIKLNLYGKDAPLTVLNFVQKAKSGFYNNLTFHRVENWVIQGGDPNGDGTGGGNIPVEFNQKPFVAGSLGQASRGDGRVQNDSQFFITKTPADWLNGKYTNYGIVTQGMDVVNQIQIGDKIQSITISGI